MRIAVISDIHSNLLALNLAMDSLKNESIDYTYFLLMEKMKMKF